MKIIQTSNFGGTAPNETFLNAPVGSEEQAEKIAAALNAVQGPYGNRYFKVVPDNYKLQSWPRLSILLPVREG